MEEKTTQGGTVEVRLFGPLLPLGTARGLHPPFRHPVPPGGTTGARLAAELGLPRERIEAVFRNGTIQGLRDRILPGDRVSFVPVGVPGPYRVLLAIRGAHER